MSRPSVWLIGKCVREIGRFEILDALESWCYPELRGQRANICTGPALCQVLVASAGTARYSPRERIKIEPLNGTFHHAKAGSGGHRHAGDVGLYGPCRLGRGSPPGRLCFFTTVLGRNPLTLSFIVIFADFSLKWNDWVWDTMRLTATTAAFLGVLSNSVQAAMLTAVLSSRAVMIEPGPYTGGHSGRDPA
jgi:hypothetical protein